MRDEGGACMMDMGGSDEDLQEYKLARLERKYWEKEEAYDETS